VTHKTRYAAAKVMTRRKRKRRKRERERERKKPNLRASGQALAHTALIWLAGRYIHIYRTWGRSQAKLMPFPGTRPMSVEGHSRAPWDSSWPTIWPSHHTTIPPKKTRIKFIHQLRKSGSECSPRAKSQDIHRWGVIRSKGLYIHTHICILLCGPNSNTPATEVQPPT